MSSYQISQEYSFQSVLFAIAGAIYTVAGWVRCLIAYLVSWETAAKAAVKTVAWFAVTFGLLFVTAMFPGVALCILLLVSFAVMGKPKGN